MANFIQNPISNQNWNPTMGDYYSERIHEEDKLYERKIAKRKMMIGGLISVHVLMLAIVLILF